MKKTITGWCLDNFRYYVVFSKGIFFVLGLVCTYQSVENVVFSILVTYISAGWSDPDMPKAAIIVNIHKGTYQVLQIFFAYVKDAYSGLFKMLVCCTPLYVIGLLLCFTSSLKEEDFLDPRMFYTGLVLLTLSHAGIEVTLKEFLEDQVLATDQPTTETKEEIDTTKKACSRKDFWWISASVLAAIVAVVESSWINSFKMVSMVSAIAMGIAFLWFLLGKTFYKVDNQPADNPLRDALFVICTAIAERGESYPDEQISPHVSWLRWLDRAANNVDEEALVHEKVKGVKFLLKMLPMWMTFITFSLVSATGNTFFLEQATEINDEGFFILLFINLKGFTGFVAEKISNYVLEKYFKKKKNIAQKMMLLRIGVGMICCVLCCITAWTIAAWRYRHPELDMSIFVLTPQFVLLGFMTGLAQNGLESFFDSQVSEMLNGYGQHFGQFVKGLGKYVSVVCIVIFRKNWFGWLKDDLSLSRLDKYYAVLAVLSMLNLRIYCLVAHWYGDDTLLSEDHKVDAEDHTLSSIKVETDPSDAQDQTTSDIKQHVRPLDIRFRTFPHRSSAVGPSNGAYRRIYSG